MTDDWLVYQVIDWCTLCVITENFSGPLWYPVTHPGTMVHLMVRAWTFSNCPSVPGAYGLPLDKLYLKIYPWCYLGDTWRYLVISTWQCSLGITWESVLENVPMVVLVIDTWRFSLIPTWKLVLGIGVGGVVPFSSLNPSWKKVTKWSRPGL